jgi:hypothetical protein
VSVRCDIVGGGKIVWLGKEFSDGNKIWVGVGDMRSSL